MPNPFSRTTRAIERDVPRIWLAMTWAGAVLLLGWIVWLVFGTVPLYEVSRSARLEVSTASHPLAASRGGRVVASGLVIGRAVAVGEPLVELDARAESLELAEAQARVHDTAAQLDALRAEIEAEIAAAAAALERNRLQEAEAEARLRAARARAEHAREELARADELLESGAVTSAEVSLRRRDARAEEAAAEAARHTAAGLVAQTRADQRERDVRLARLRRTAAELRGDTAVDAAIARRLAVAVDQRTIRSPVAGRIGSGLPLRPGTVVDAGQVLGTVIPEGRIRAVAMLAPAALGRVRPGQRARVRLEGFPWSQFGTLPARVEQMATEPVGGAVRIELALTDPAEAAMPLSHGLEGEVEVLVERVAPWRLLLRLAGQRIRPAADATTPTTALE